MSKNDEVSDIASKHLGQKQGDYTQKHTPGDPNILVAIPRSIDRKGIGYSEYASDGSDYYVSGTDVWRGYEVSCMMSNGLPANFIATLSFNQCNENLIESKSMKLFWNSFNDKVMGDTQVECHLALLTETSQALSSKSNTKCDGDVFVQMRGTFEYFNPLHSNLLNMRYDDRYVSLSPIIIDSNKFEESSKQPPLAEKNVVGDYGTMFATTSSLRSNCRVTHQPDFGDITVFIEGASVPSIEGFFRYIVGMRNENHFHEEIVERVLIDLLKKFSPEFVAVVANYTRRGGWDIRPFRYAIKNRDDTSKYMAVRNHFHNLATTQSPRQ